MDELQKATLQVVFEHFRFNAFYSSSTPYWTFAKHLSTLDPSDISRHTRTGLLIESGFSFSHVSVSVFFKSDHPNRRRQCCTGRCATRECGREAADESAERNAFLSTDERAGLFPLSE